MNGVVAALTIAVSAIAVITALIRFGMWIADVNADRKRSARALARIGRALGRRRYGRGLSDNDEEQEGR